MNISSDGKYIELNGELYAIEVDMGKGFTAIEDKALTKKVLQILQQADLEEANLEEISISQEGVKLGTDTVRNVDDVFQRQYGDINKYVSRIARQKIVHAKIADKPLSAHFSRLEPISTKARVSEFFRRLFMNKAESEKAQRRDTRALIEQTRAKIQVASKVETPKNVTEPMVLPKDLAMSKGESQVLKISKKIVAEEALAQRFYRQAGDFIPSEVKGVTVTPVRLDSPKPIFGQVIPTSHRTARPKRADHLMNCYISDVKGKDVGFGRSGVIDTETKANEWLRAVNMLDRRADQSKPLRVVSHQLNSPEPERAMIKNQHYQMNRLNAENEDIIQIAHINTPFSRFYDYNKNLGDVLFKGEKESHKMNIEACAQYLLWFMEDANIQALGLEDKLKAVREASQTAYETKTRGSKELAVKRRELKNTIYEIMKGITQGSYGKLSEEDAKTAKLLEQLINVQLELIPKKERSHRAVEAMRLHLLNDRLHVVTWNNCKSGLDRTGLSYAVKMAMEQLDIDDPDFLEQWDTDTRTMNKEARHGPGHFYTWLQSLDGSERERYEKILEFKNQILQNLVTVCLPITGVSTGVGGLKWYPGKMGANLIALNFLPSFVEVEGAAVPLVEYNERGGVGGYTPHTIQLLTQLSSRRGS